MRLLCAGCCRRTSQPRWRSATKEGASSQQQKLSGAITSNWEVSWSAYFFFQAEDGIRRLTVTGVQTCALPIFSIGTAEFFMLTLLGITFLSSLSGSNLIKVLIGGGLGLSLAMVGLDPIESIPRFTLEPLLGEANALFLWDGVALVAVTVGLFAIPEIIDLGVQRTSIARTAINKVGGVMEGVKDTF